MMMSPRLFLLLSCLHFDLSSDMVSAELSSMYSGAVVQKIVSAYDEYEKRQERQKRVSAAKKNQGNFEHHKKNRIQEKKG